MTQIKNYLIATLILLSVLIACNFVFYFHEAYEKPYCIEIVGANYGENTDTTIVVKNYEYKHFKVLVK